jgi:mRNA interferase RelE/StbE
MFQIVLTPSAHKNLAKLDPPVRRPLAIAIDSLSQGLNSNCKKLQGSHADYRLRVGDYRIIFELTQTQLIIRIIRIAHCKDVYKI